MADEPRLLGGRYELGSQLGRGGMAQVRRGRDIRLGREVAIKLLRADLAGDSTFQGRFRREAQASAGLNHPNIVAVYDTGEELDLASGVHVPYIVMELVEGHTLREVLRDGRKILPERALEFTAGVLDALAYSHRAGIVHRDIKPANVMLTTGGRVKVMDFGIARAVADTSATMTQTAAVIGTAQYLSPEQARGETVDSRSDIYSAGCMLYELLVGHPPFRGDSPVSVVYQHVRENPVPPSQLDPLITADMDAIVLKALAKDVRDRYQSAAEMRDDLNRLLAGEPIRALPPTSIAGLHGAEDATRVMPTVPISQAATAPVAAPPTSAGPARARSAAAPQRAVQAPPRGQRNWLWAVAVFLVVLALGLGGFLIFGPRVTQVAVPNVTTRSRDLAEKQLQDAQLKVAVQEITGADDATVGKVISQDPVGGMKVAAGSLVTIQVNVGPKKATIPTNLVGMSVSKAEQALRELGFNNVTREEDLGNTTAKANIVTNVNPTGGVNVSLDTPITVYFAPGTGIVPNFFGMTRARAQGQADREGFSVSFSEQESAELPAGQVIDQNPAAGDEIKRTQRIRLVLAKAPAAPSPPSSSAPPSVSPTPSESP